MTRDEVTLIHVIPAKAGTHLRSVQEMGSRVRGNDGRKFSLIAVPFSALSQQDPS